MSLIRPAALLLGGVMAAPALYRGFVTEELDITSALGRFLVAVVVAGVMLAVLRFVTAGYGRPVTPARRVSDQDDPPVLDPPG